MRQGNPSLLASYLADEYLYFVLPDIFTHSTSIHTTAKMRLSNKLGMLLDAETGWR